MNIAWSFSLAGIDLEPSDEKYRDEHIVGGSTTNKTSLFQAYRIELLRVLGEINSTPVALSIGVGLENNNYKFNDYE